MFYALLCIVILLVILIKYWRERSHSHLISVDGQAVLITGCDSGLGLQVAQHFHSLGLTVIATCLNDQSEGAQHLRSSLFSNTGRMRVTQLDVTQNQSIQQCSSYVEQVLKETGQPGLWALINNSGVCVTGEFEWLTSEQIDRQISVNFRAPMAMCRSFLPLIRKVKGRIINVGSVNGTCAYPGFSVYCGTKYALEGVSDAMRYELAKTGVKVIIIRPGDFARLTGIMHKMQSDMDEMWAQLGESEKKYYSPYFNDYFNHIKQNYGYTSPDSYESTNLFNHFRSAVLSRQPYYSYTISPWSQRYFFKLLNLLPAHTKDNLIHYLSVRLFNFDDRAYFKIEK